jgi:hypothetical protein
MFRPPSAQDVNPSVEAERLGKRRTIHGAPPAVLVDSLFSAETSRQPDGTDVVNTVRVRVTADEWRKLPTDMDRRLMDLLREHWPVKDVGGE